MVTPRSRICLITGAAHGIGAATARAAAQNGYALSINYLEARKEAEALVLAIALAPTSGFATVLRLAPLAWLGKVSYSIYMVHWAVLFVFYIGLVRFGHVPMNVDGVFQTGNLVGGMLALFAVAVVLVVSHFTFTYLEAPCRNWSKRARIARAKLVSEFGDEAVV